MGSPGRALTLIAVLSLWPASAVGQSAALMDDLAWAIEQQLATGPLTNEQVRTIVAALASVASEVERVLKR